MSILNFILIFIQIIKILNQDNFFFPLLKIVLQKNKMLFERYVSDNILNHPTYKKCSDAIEDLMQNNSNLFDYSNIFFFTGKDANDIGSERECLDKEGTYIILGFKHYKNQTFYNNEIERIKLISFLYQQTTFIGVCLDKCSDFILNAFFGENTKLSVMEDDLKINYVYKNYTLPEKEIEDKNKTNIFSEYYDYKSAKIPLLIIILVILFIKIVAFLIQRNKFTRGYEFEGKDKLKDLNLSLPNSIINSFTNNIMQIENNKTTNIQKKEKSNIENYLELYSGVSNYNPEFDRQSLFSKKLRILKYLDIVDNFNLLLGKYNRYFNSVGLERLIFIKFMIMFILTYIHIVIAIINFPYRDIFDFNIFMGFDTFIYKLFNSSTTFYIIIEGSIFSYKLLCELDKNKKSIRYIFKKFILLSIPKIIFFYLSFFFFKYIYFYFISLSETTQVFNYYHHYLIKNRKCLNSTFKLFIPFIFTLQDINNILIRENEDGNFCYEYVNISYNEFHCFIIMLLLFMISNKLKKKKFDKLMTIFIFTLFIIFQIFIYFFGEDNRIIGLYKENPIIGNEVLPKYSTGEHDFYYKLYNKLFFQNYYEKYLPSTLFFYHLGFLLGICNFYNTIHSINKKDKKQIIIYNYPFSYIYSEFYKYISNYITFIISGILMLLCSLSFFVFTKKDIDENDKKKYNIYGRRMYENVFKFNPYEWFYFSFEKGFFGILFFLIISFLIKKKIFIASFNLFNFLDRISFTYYCLLDGIIYFILSLCFIVRSLDSLSIFYLTLALYFIGSFISFIVYSVFEYTGRLIIKYLLREHLL